MILSAVFYAVLMIIAAVLPKTVFFYFILHGGFGWRHLLAYCVGISITSLLEDSKNKNRSNEKKQL